MQAICTCPILKKNSSCFQGPAEFQTSKTICCLCCVTGPVAGVLRIDRCGYVPGEAIPFSARMQNDSDRNINSVKVKLILVSSSCGFWAQGIVSVIGGFLNIVPTTPTETVACVMVMAFYES